MRLLEPGSERENALLEERRGLERQISQADRRLYDMEHMAPMLLKAG